jgi:hypothetical protein
MGKEAVIKTIGKIYEKEKISWWRKNVEHPPWKLRKIIMEELD